MRDQLQKFSFIGYLAIGYLCLLVHPNSLYAQELSRLPFEFPAISRIAVLDLLKGERDSFVWQDLQRQESTLKDAYQAKIRALQVSLKEEGESLEAQKPVIEATEFLKLRNQFNERVKNSQLESQSYKENMDLQLGKARQKVREIAKSAVITVAQELNLDIIFSNDDKSVILARDYLNITALVTKNMNEVADKINYESLEVTKSNVNNQQPSTNGN